MSALKKQEGGKHYVMPIQPIEYITKNKLPYIEGNIIEYATRHRNKNGAEDIKKIIHYCELLLELEYGAKQGIIGLMIRVTIDDDIHEADLELINDFAQAISDRDATLLDEVIYLAKQRLETTYEEFDANL